VSDIDTFSVRGRLVGGSGAPLANTFLALIDFDLLDEDDLLGIGTTDDDGRFALSFLRSEFQQDWFEDERTPGLALIASATIDGAHKPVARRDYPGLAWGDGTGDLGDVRLPEFDADPLVFLDGSPTPGFDKRAVRLTLEEPLLRHCLAEVAPLVERYTGWTDLVDDSLTLDVRDGLAAYSLAPQFAEAGIDPDGVMAKVMTFMAEYGQASGAGCALYDPGTHTIAVNRTVMEQVNLEGLKSFLGHELVHLGQFKYTPGLREYHAANVGGLDLDPDKVDLEELQQRFSYMTAMEGYAVYIQTDFLQDRHYRMATYPYHQSWLDAALRAIVAAVTPNAEATQDAKADQYTDGRELYRGAQQGDAPARWAFDVASLPGGDEFVP